MPAEDRTTRRKQETTLREAVVRSIGQFYELHGLDVALKKFDEMRLLFSGCQDWPNIDKEVTDFFIEKKRLERQADGERQQQMDEALKKGLANGLNPGQLNLLTGANPQAPYYSVLNTKEGGHES